MGPFAIWRRFWRCHGTDVMWLHQQSKSDGLAVIVSTAKWVVVFHDLFAPTDVNYGTAAKDSFGPFYGCTCMKLLPDSWNDHTSTLCSLSTCVIMEFNQWLVIDSLSCCCALVILRWVSLLEREVWRTTAAITSTGPVQAKGHHGCKGKQPPFLFLQ